MREAFFYGLIAGAMFLILAHIIAAIIAGPEFIDINKGVLLVK